MERQSQQAFFVTFAPDKRRNVEEHLGFGRRLPILKRQNFSSLFENKNSVATVARMS